MIRRKDPTTQRLKRRLKTSSNLSKGITSDTHTPILQTIKVNELTGRLLVVLFYTVVNTVFKGADIMLAAMLIVLLSRATSYVWLCLFNAFIFSNSLIFLNMRIDFRHLYSLSFVFLRRELNYQGGE